MRRLAIFIVILLGAAILVPATAYADLTLPSTDWLAKTSSYTCEWFLSTMYVQQVQSGQHLVEGAMTFTAGGGVDGPGNCTNQSQTALPGTLTLREDIYVGPAGHQATPTLCQSSGRVVNGATAHTITWSMSFPTPPCGYGTYLLITTIYYRAVSGQWVGGTGYSPLYVAPVVYA